MGFLRQTTLSKDLASRYDTAVFSGVVELYMSQHVCAATKDTRGAIILYPHHEVSV